MRAWCVLVCLLSVTLAGCVGNEPIPNEGEGASALTNPVLLLGAGASDGTALWTMGSELIGPDADNENNPPPFMPLPPRPACGEDNCETIPFTIGDTGGLDVAVALEWAAKDETWDTTFFPGGYLGSPAAMMDAIILKDDQEVADVIESFHYAGGVVLESPEPGDYAIETVIRFGQADYLVSIQSQASDVLDQPDANGDILPDLIAIPPDHPTFQYPIGHEAGTATAATVGGCGPDEMAEDQDLRCLRFAGIIGNQGPGEFLTILEYEEAAASIATPGGNWAQVIQTESGEPRVVPIGPADYHEVHGHFHILDFVATQLYTYDEQTDTRGEAVGDGRKMGFCIIDGGYINPLAPITPPTYSGNGCCYIAGTCQLDMATNPHFQMGMSPGWYDIYPWWRSDQYVEVSDLPDGAYELVSVINPDGLIEESNHDNNEASTILRITGDQIEVIEQRTQAALGPHPDADWGYTAAHGHSASDDDDGNGGQGPCDPAVGC